MELAIIELIYSTTRPENNNSINEKLQEVEKTLDSRLKAQGWMSYFSKSG